MMMMILLPIACALLPAAGASSPGKVAVASVEGRCEVSVTTAEQGTVRLLAVDDCGEPHAGLTEEKRVGTLLLPAIAGTGEEFHVFSVPTARGGNACRSAGQYDYYVVAVSPGHAWASENLGGCVDFASAEVGIGKHGATLSLVNLPTTRSDGQRVDVWLGGVETTAIPAIAQAGPDTPRTYVGRLDALGGGWTSFQPFVEDANGVQEIFGAGPCKLDALDGKNVIVTVKRAPPNAGPFDDICVSIAPGK